MDIKREALKSALESQGKIAIHVPLRESEAQQKKTFFQELFDKALISQDCYDRTMAEIESITLDARTYLMFAEVIGSNCPLPIKTLKTQ